MKKIEVDGKTYVDIKTYTNLENKYSAVLDKRKKETVKDACFNKLHCYYLDDANVMGIGSVKFEGEWIATKISISYLDSIMKGLKQLGFDSLELMWAKNQPVIFGKYDKEKREASGIILAPRVDGD